MTRTTTADRPPPTTWHNADIRRAETDRYLRDGRDFIPDQEILDTLRTHAHPDAARVREIVSKAYELNTLQPDEMAVLLNVEDPELLAEMTAAAGAIKKKVYDNRIVTFAPLYMSNLCVNNCLYCGFRRDNTESLRRRLTMDEVRQETRALVGTIGHKRLIVVYGEHPSTSTDYIAETIRTVYAEKVTTRRGTAEIRRVNVNAAPLPVQDLKVLKSVGIGTFQVFQETYHHDTFARVHPNGTIKSDYRWRLYCMHRALEAGVDDVGIGALFGLYHWKFEAMGLLYHARELESRYGIGPHTISFPRLEPAGGSTLSRRPEHAMSDAEFKRLVVVLRLSVPYTGMIVTARESRQVRDDVITAGCTQADASTRIGIGAYADADTRQATDRQQFMLGDTRSLEELICDLARRGMITSFCTAAYRCGRTGGCIMDMLKTGKEGKFCKVNAVLTFREWLEDFATPDALEICRPVHEIEIAEIRRDLPMFAETFLAAYRRIEQGERDLYF